MKVISKNAYRINLTVDSDFEVALDYYRNLFPFLKDNEIIKTVFSLSIGEKEQKTKLSASSLLKKISRKYPRKKINWKEEQNLIDEIEA